MDAIEPNWPSLLWFALFWTACCLGFLVVMGMFPLASRPEATRGRGGLVLILWNAALLLALVIGTGLYGFAELRWSSLIVVGGLVILFAPGLFEAWPAAWRDGRTGLLTLLALQGVALVLLYAVGGTGLRSHLS